MAEIFPIRRKTLYNQSINQSILYKLFMLTCPFPAPYETALQHR